MYYVPFALIKTLFILSMLLTGFLFASNSNLGFATTNSSDIQEQDSQPQLQQQGDIASDENVASLSTSTQDESQEELPQGQEQTAIALSLDQKLSELTPAEEVSIDKEVNSAVEDVLDNPTEDPQSIKICIHREKLPDGTKGACDLWIEITIKITVN